MSTEVQADPDRACLHPDFAAIVEVNRIYEGPDESQMPGAFSADLRIKCVACGEPFRFIGVPAGLLFTRPACSPDETELHIPIRPASSDRDFGLGIPGYAITYQEN